MLPAVLLHGRWAALRQCSHACQCLGCSRYLFRILLAYHFEIPSAGRWWSARSPTTDEARLSQRSVIAFGPRLEICAAQEVRAASVCRRPSDSELRGRNVHRLKEKRSVRSVPMPHARPCEITNAGGTQAGGGNCPDGRASGKAWSCRRSIAAPGAESSRRAATGRSGWSQTRSSIRKSFGKPEERIKPYGASEKELPRATEKARGQHQCTLGQGPLSIRSTLGAARNVIFTSKSS
jgi:hypothetical protein